jgi:acyl-CoA thioesterase-1
MPGKMSKDTSRNVYNVALRQAPAVIRFTQKANRSKNLTRFGRSRGWAFLSGFWALLAVLIISATLFCPKPAMAETPGIAARGGLVMPGADLLGAVNRTANETKMSVDLQMAKTAAKPTIVLFGDSLIAGYGLPKDDGFAPNLAGALEKAGHPARVINSGVSGDTTAAGLARLDWALADQPDLVVLELGANDALRGVEPSETRENLEEIITKLQARNIAVLLVGMMAPPNMGKEYGAEFNAIFPDLARKYDVPLYPFFLDGIAAQPALNQGDGMHPNAKGVDIIVKRIMPSVIDALPAGAQAS